MPFSGKDCNEIIKKNRTGKISFDFEKYDIHLSNETMELLTALLELEPEKRLSAN